MAFRSCGSSIRLVRPSPSIVLSLRPSNLLRKTRSRRSLSFQDSQCLSAGSSDRLPPARLVETNSEGHMPGKPRTRHCAEKLLFPNFISPIYRLYRIGEVVQAECLVRSISAL